MINRKNHFQVIQTNLAEKYNNQCSYGDVMIDQLIYNKNSHYSSLFKDRMLYDYLDEFLKRYYYAVESYDRIPKMSKYYTNYLKFFCKPSFREFEVNFILKRYGDNRAELYYIRNYGKGDLENENGEHQKEHVKTLLTTTVKENINHNSLTRNSILEITSQMNNNEVTQSSFNTSHFSHCFYDESKSVLLTKRSNKDESLVNILFLMDPLKINEQFLVKDKMNKKGLSNGYKNSHVDKTTKDYSSKINNAHNDLNKIEIKELKTIETEREVENGSNRNRASSINNNDNSCINKHNYDVSPIKASINLLTNGAEGVIRDNQVQGNKIITENKLNPKTRNMQLLPEKSNEFTISQAHRSNIYSTILNPNKKCTSPIIQNKFLEKIQNEALKALKRIKRTKLEFKNPTAKSKNDNPEIKVVYVDTHADVINGNEVNSRNNHHVPNNNNFNIINDMLKFTLNDKNSRNKPKYEATKTDNKLSIYTTMGKNNINYADHSTTSRRDKVLTTNDDNNLLTQGRTPNSKSPIGKGDTTSNLNLQMNVLKNLADKTKKLSRNKNPTILGVQNSTNMKSRNQKHSKEKENSSTVYKSFKSYKSFKKDKSVITQSVVNLNIQTPNIEELEKKIFGTFASNQNGIKRLVNPKIENKHIKNESIKKSTEKKDPEKQFKILKTVSNLMRAANATGLSQMSLKTSQKMRITTKSNNNNTNNQCKNPYATNVSSSNKTKVGINTNLTKKKVPSFDSKSKNGGVFNIYSTTMALRKQTNK